MNKDSNEKTEKKALRLNSEVEDDESDTERKGERAKKNARNQRKSLILSKDLINGLDAPPVMNSSAKKKGIKDLFFKKEGKKTAVEQKMGGFLQSEKGKGALSKLRMMLALKQASDPISPTRSPSNKDQKEEYIMHRREKQGYTSAELKSLYPSTFYKERITTLDKLSHDKKFSSENIIQTEKLALPCSEFIYRIVKNCIELTENKGIQDLIKIRPRDNSLLLDLFFDFEGLHFERIFRVNLLDYFKENIMKLLFLVINF